MSQHARDLVRQGIEAHKAGDTETARKLLLEASQLLPNNQNVWLWLSDVAEDDTTRREYLERVLMLDPQSAAGQTAQKKLSEQDNAPSTTTGESDENAQDTSSAPTQQLPPLSTEPHISPEAYSWEDSSFEEEEDAEQEESWAWLKRPTTPLAWAVLVAVGVLGIVIIWAIILAFSGMISDEPEQTATGITATQVVTRFQTAGLEAENVRPMTEVDYGTAPLLCQEDNARFFIPSLPVPEAGGRVFVCPTIDDVARLKLHYDQQGQQDDSRFSWTFTNDTVLVQLNGALPQEVARQYGTVVNALSVGEPPVLSLSPTIQESYPIQEVTQIVEATAPPPTAPPPTAPPPTAPPPTAPPPTAPPPTQAQPVEPTVAPPLPTDTLVPAVPLPTATPEPAPTLEQAPPGEPLEFSGTGPTTTDPFLLPSLTNRVFAQHEGEGQFLVNTSMPEGDVITQEVLVNTTGPYTGTTLLTGDTNSEFYLDIIADGAWRVEIEAIETQDTPIGELNGTGDFVSDFFPPPSAEPIPYQFQHSGTEDFVVYLRCADGQVALVSERGSANIQRDVSFADGPCLWVVNADGEWSITPQ